MDLSIIILNYQTRGLLKNCLNGILQCPPQVSHEIIVVDNDSRDGSAEMIRQKFPGVKLIVSPENVGHPAGNNLGIRQASGRYILILNSDIVIMDQAINALVQLMDSHEQVAAASPKLVNPDGTIQMNCHRFPTLATPVYSRTIIGRLWFARKNLSRYLMTDFDHAQARSVDWLLAACLIVRAAAIEKVGLMDETFFLYFGDVDWCRQFKNSGWQVYYFPEAQIVHYHRRESADDRGFLSLLNKKTRIHILDWWRYINKYSAHSLGNRHADKIL